MAVDIKNFIQRTLQAAKAPRELDDIAAAAPAPAPPITASKGVISSVSSLAKALVGTTGAIEEAYFPPDVVGGTCPRVVGEEEEIVWNAAAEACDSERVHVVWQSFENRIWYLAVKASDIASHPNSWCPFAAVLPGGREARPAPTCYTNYGEEMATMMMVTQDSLQIFRGTNLVVRAKAERTSRENNNALIVEMVPDTIAELTPIPWYSVSLFEDRARRVIAVAAVLSSITLTGLAFLVWFFASLSLVSAKRDLADTQRNIQNKVTDLMAMVQQLHASPVRDQLAKFGDLNEGLLDLNGYLEIYELKNGRERWRAVVPGNVTADRINAIGGKTIDTKPEGTIIGNAAEIDYEAGIGAR
ncbi:MAG: hypothetical protein JO126_06790 [Alphaproteobacteria bacterium]|nr:hypothetical protein [Alphaproteobacteria bacterium]MBV8549145.1 hypothetical protein [Alphaproteobacteria bacterium]